MVNPDRDLRKALPLATVAGLAVLVGVIGYLRADPEPSRDHIYIPSSSGPVLLTHARHAGLADDCVNCHHELVRGDAVACSECHDEAGYVPDMIDHDDLARIKAHVCGGCHDVAANQEALNCRQCHPAVATDRASLIDCQTCHDSSYTPDLMDHAALLDIEGHTCKGCHVLSSVADSYHAQCNACHLAAAPAVFQGADGSTLCAACHLK